MARRRHTPEQIIRKLAEGQELLAGGVDLEGVASSRSRSRPGRGGYPSTLLCQTRLGRLTPIEFETIIKPAADQAA